MLFSSDAAIKSKKEDALNRATFSEHLGNAILDWTKKETMVLGLYGEWGTGKSSIINLALEHINNKTKNDGASEPIIFRFNPWNFTEQNQLVTIFLSELSKTIGFQGKSEQASSVGKTLISYSKFFTPLSILATLFPQFAPLMKLPEETLRGIGDAAKQWAELNEKDLQALKSELDNQIVKLNRKIIIVIDDIDRLNKLEIRQIFQLVKMNANFPNTIYILSLDDQKVATLLTEDKFPGKDYLEKIVQVPFHVPAIERKRIEKILFNELNSIIKPLQSKETPFDRKKWQDIYFEGLSGLFPSLRRVKRFINGLCFTITIVPNEINVIDFIGIEAIRVFFPEVYTRIAKNKALFVGDDFSFNEDDRKTKIEKLQKLIEVAPEPDKKYLTKIIYQLFPQFTSNYGSEWQDIWEGKKLICSRYRFDSYFFLSVPEGHLSQQRIDHLLLQASNRNDLEKSLIALIKSKKIRKFLIRIPDFKERILEKNIPNFIIAIFNIADILPQNRENDLDFGATMEATRIAYQLLNKIQDEKKRQRIATKVIRETSGIIAPIEFLSYEVSRMKKNEATRLIKDDKVVEKLVLIMSNKLNKRAKEDNLKSIPSLTTVLRIWKGWGGEDNARELITYLLKNNGGIGRILEGFSWQKQFGNPKDVKLWDIDIDGLGMFTNIEVLTTKIETLSRSEIISFTSQQKMALKLYRKKINILPEASEEILTI